MSKVIDRIKLAAERLEVARASIKKIEESVETQLESLKIERDKAQEELLALLAKEGLSAIKTDSGASYTRSKTRSLAIVNEVFALGWAIENRAVSINKVLVKQKLDGAKEAPQGFEFVEGECIRITNPKSKVEKNNQEN